MKNYFKRTLCSLFAALMLSYATLPAAAAQEDSVYTQSSQTVLKNTYTYGNLGDFSEETVEEFFANSAFVGDSVMYGFELYSTRKKTIQSSSVFLTKTSFAARHALKDVSANSYHPSYNGQKMLVEDALALSGVNKVFISIGLNDVRVTPNSYFENYVEMINRIKAKNPDIAVFIVSSTYPVLYPGNISHEEALAYRAQLYDLNCRLMQYAADGNAYFIDVVSPLVDATGFLDPNFSSDNYVHLRNSAYQIWMERIELFAKNLILLQKIKKLSILDLIGQLR